MNKSDVLIAIKLRTVNAVNIYYNMDRKLYCEIAKTVFFYTILLLFHSIRNELNSLV